MTEGKTRFHVVAIVNGPGEVNLDVFGRVMYGDLASCIPIPPKSIIKVPHIESE